MAVVARFRNVDGRRLLIPNHLARGSVDVVVHLDRGHCVDERGSL